MINDQKFVDQQNLIDSNIGTISSQGQTLNDHQVLIQTNTDGIANNGNRIQENLNGIQTNGQTIQSLSDNFFNSQNSLVKFHVESNAQGDIYWPSNTGINFKMCFFCFLFINVT